MNISVIEPLAVSQDYLNNLIAELETLNHKVTYYNSKPKGKSDVIERSKNAEVVMLVNTPFSKDVINECENLKMVSIAFTGFDHVDVKECENRGIVVSNAAGYATDSVAELTFGLISAIYRKLISSDATTKDGNDRTGLLGTEIKGKSLGIVGTGAIGTRVAQLGNIYGCNLIGYNSSKKKECEDIGMKYQSLDDLMSNSDIVSVHLPLNDKTSNLINKDNLSLMNKNSILINTSRGGVVNEKELAAALNNNDIAGAGIDVFEVEPPLPTDHVLLKAKNAITTPHIAFATKEALEKRADIAFGNVVSWLENSPQNVVS